MVEVKMQDEQFARIKFEKFLAYNNLSADKRESGEYYYRETQNKWVSFLVGFRAGRESAGGTCEF